MSPDEKEQPKLRQQVDMPQSRKLHLRSSKLCCTYMLQVAPPQVRPQQRRPRGGTPGEWEGIISGDLFKDLFLCVIKCIALLTLSALDFYLFKHALEMCDFNNALYFIFLERSIGDVSKKNIFEFVVSVFPGKYCSRLSLK